MSARSTINNFPFFLALMLLSACTGLKRLPPGKKLYTGYAIKLTHTEPVKKQNKIRSVIKDHIKLRANQSYGGMRPKLWLWEITGEAPRKKWKKKLRDKSEAPIFINDIDPAQTAKYIDAAMFNIGIFNSLTEYKIVETKKTAKIVFTTYVHPPFTLNNIVYEIKEPSVQHRILAENEKGLLKKGDDYSLDNLKAERERINRILKNHGFYFFNPDYIIFKADTMASERKVNVRLDLKSETPPNALQSYRINNIRIDIDKMPGEHNDSLHPGDIHSSDSLLIAPDVGLKPKVLRSSILMKKNDIYSLKMHNATLNRLMSLGVYKFVRISFHDIDSTHHLLNMHLLLNPMSRRSVRAELNMVSKSNDFIGPHLDLNYTNRNTFKGAEALKLNLGGSFETQISGKYKNLFSYTFNSKAELSVPGFVVPFKLQNVSTYFVPKTRFAISYNYLRRVGYFDMRSLNFVYGYKWKENALKEHELNPVNLNITNVTRQTDEFKSLLEANPYIKKSYEQQFIPGALYSFDYNEQVRVNRKNQFHSNITTEAAGNLLSLAAITQGKFVSPEDPQRIFGLVYSQFFKVSADLRNYLNFKNSKLAARFFSGVGKAYGNSSTLPYIKQFFSGGPNSIRAFPINSLGPGTFTPQFGLGSLFLQQGGDIKLETNIEYRFDIIRSFKGAVFADAGNTWLMKSNPALMTNAFSFSEFYKEIAVGAGVGLRFDISFFVLRADVATPLRKPWLPYHQRWVINQFDLSDPSWRSDNIILNIAIGYPF
jgi:outer membrane protein assembly factor BamA